MHSSLVTTTLVHCVLTARCQRSIQLDMLDCYDVSVQPQTRPRSSLTFVWRYTPFVAYTPKPHGHNLCATITLLVLSYCPYVFCVDCSYLWATGHASYCLDHVYRRDERGGERSSRFYRPLTRCASLTRQPARYATAHSTTGPFSHSSPDGNTLDNGPTCSPLTLVHDDLDEPRRPFTLPPRLRSRPHFTSRIVLLVEDNSNDSAVIGEQQSRLTSYQRRKVGLSKKAREWSMRSQSSYYGYLSVQRNVTGSQLRLPLLPYPVTPVPGVSKTVIFGALSSPVNHLIYVLFNRPSR